MAHKEAWKSHNNPNRQTSDQLISTSMIPGSLEPIKHPRTIQLLPKLNYPKHTKTKN